LRPIDAHRPIANYSSTILTGRLRRAHENQGIMDFIKKYRWYLIGMVALYAGISLWLFFMTDSPQAVPFEYQVN
jgi:hypothetical protein